MINYLKKLFSSKKNIIMSSICLVLVIALVATIAVCTGKKGKPQASLELASSGASDSLDDATQGESIINEDESGEDSTNEEDSNVEANDSSVKADSEHASKSSDIPPVTEEVANDAEEAPQEMVMPNQPEEPVSELGNEIVSDSKDSNFITVDSQDDDHDINEDASVKIPSGSTDKIETGVINPKSYYQYLSLNETEQAVYNEICNAVKQTVTVVNLEKYGATPNYTMKAFTAVMGDHPEFFWLYRDMTMSYERSSGTISTIALRYTDGKIIDSLNNHYELIATADRSLIKSQISSLSDCIKKVMAQIPSNGTQLEKEKAIHDYLVRHLDYNYDAITNPNATLRSFDAYGALHDNYCVCEGYSKAFQLLCYQAGINATQVWGEANSGGGHMWNTANIDGSWYFVDCTWADSLKDHIYYKFFNITGSELAETHTCNDTVKVPSCTSTQYNYRKTCVFHIGNANAAPDNISTICKLMKNTNSSEIIFMFDGVKPTQEYLSKFIYGDSEFRRQVQAAGYSISLTNNYGIADCFVYWEGTLN